VPSRVYVIELDPAAGRRRDPRIPWVYVGSSARSPKDRFSQHRRGYKSAGIVKRHARRLRPDLYEDIAPIRGSRQAVVAELKRAEELAACGFVAHCDGTSYGREGGHWVEWDAERLEPVLGHLDAAIAELAASTFEPIDAERCAALLHGERQFWVRDYIDQEDPPPSYSQFAHVKRRVLEERAALILGGKKPRALKPSREPQPRRKSRPGKAARARRGPRTPD
jgi:hypothetical protein